MNEWRFCVSSFFHLFIIHLPSAHDVMAYTFALRFCICSYLFSFIHSFIFSFIHSFIFLFIHSFFLSVLSTIENYT